MFRHILVGTDGSPEAEDAVAMAADLARQFLGKVLIVYVTPRIPHTLGGPADVFVGEEFDEEKTYADELLARAAAIVEKRGVEFKTLHRVGRPAHELVRTAEEEGCDHMVLGSKGRSAISRMLLGTVVSEVAQLAACPVTIIR